MVEVAVAVAEAVADNEGLLVLLEVWRPFLFTYMRE